MLTADQILTTQFITGVVRAYPQQAFIGAGILPLVNEDGWETMWDIIVRDDKIAPFVAASAESPLADKAAIQRGFSELANIRIKEVLSESELVKLRLPGTPDVMQSGSLLGTMRNKAEAHVRKTTDRMSARVLGRVELMRWEALTGTITYDDNKVKFSVDYGIPADQKIVLTTTDRWSDTTNSDPVADITDGIEKVYDVTGRMPEVVYVGSSVPGNLVKNAKVRDLFKANNVITSLVSTKTVLQTLGSILGVRIERVTTSYLSDAGTATKMLDANRIIIMPNAIQPDGETLGDVATGPAQVNNYEPGLYGWVKVETDPPATFVGAGIHAFPRIRHANWLYVVDTCGAI